MSNRNLEERIAVAFRDPLLLEMALTHKSAVNEGLSRSGHNERLEFLGDAILGAAVADLLYDAFPEASEGSLTNMRADLVRQSGLASWARKLDIGPHLILGRGEEERGGRERDGLIASAFEALVGAIYRDQGYAAVLALIGPLVAQSAPVVSASDRPNDAKSALQHRAQARWGTLPAYRVLEMQGPEHRPVFTVQVQTEDGTIAQGVGPSRQAAEQEAARHALDLLGDA